MNTNLHVTFPGTCDEAFGFYEQVFGTKRPMTMRYGDMQEGSPVPEGAKDLVMHTSLQVGSMVLMGADMPPEREGPVGGFEIAVNVDNADEARRLYDALVEGGVVVMPLARTFWSPLFGMLTDKFGVGWMVGLPGAEL
jgi:PhnB protein